MLSSTTSRLRLPRMDSLQWVLVLLDILSLAIRKAIEDLHSLSLARLTQPEMLKTLWPHLLDIGSFVVVKRSGNYVGSVVVVSIWQKHDF